VCPGKYFAEDGLWLLFAQFLAVFNVSADPKAPAPKVEFTSGSLSYVRFFFVASNADTYAYEQPSVAIQTHNTSTVRS